MNDMVNDTVRISDIVGGGICVSALDGQLVYKEIYEKLTAGRRVTISFYGVTRMTTAFLNAAVGQLYGEFNEEDLRSRLAPPVDCEPWQIARLRLVIERSKLFFQDRERMQNVAERITGLEK